LVNDRSLVDPSLSALETFLRARLTEALPGASAQWLFAPSPTRKGWRPDDQPATAREAAALILLYPGEQGVSFPLTVRHDDLPHHPGQISLPGGGLDPGEDPATGALREAHEELGVDPRDVRIIGALSPLWVIVSNFLVRPFIGVADHRPAFQPSPREVSQLIETPVAWVRDTSRVGVDQRARDGIFIKYPYFDFNGHHVWGATGMVLAEFRAVLDGHDG
jgi:8-oxo-dGTP pyrophosphatase MutT (NUDIX family)